MLGTERVEFIITVTFFYQQRLDPCLLIAQV